MVAPRALPIVGYGGEPVPNEFLRQEGGADHLALLLPGFAYTCDMPLFYHAENVLLDAGIDVLRVEYGYHRRPDVVAASEEEQRRRLFADVAAAWRAGTAQRPYATVTLIGKSLGTLAMGHLLAELPTTMGVCAVWLTPLLRDDDLRGRMRRFPGPSLVAIGTADPHHDAALLDELGGSPGCEAVVVGGADHSLDVPGDPVGSVRAVERVVAALVAFVGGADTAGDRRAAPEAAKPASP